VTLVPDDPVHLLALAVGIAEEAATLIAEGRRRGLSEVGTKSSSTDMVTEYDRLSERLIVERLRTARPNDGIVGEEGSSTTGTSGIEWLVDPIDGTTNFLYALPGYAVSIGARDAEGGLVGVVAIPSSAELFAARRSGGATCNGEPIRCSGGTDLSRALVATGFSYDPARRRHQGARVAAMLDRIRDIRRLGAAAPDLCHVAAGRVDAYFEEYLNPWDLAAGEVIAREAGCRLGALDGGPLHPGSVLVATPDLFEPLVELIAGIGAGSGPDATL
jgi:myo-inositol-1(or 4)-monophosphatase